MKKIKEEKIVIRYSRREILAIVLGILFIPSLVIFLVSLTLQQTVINPKYYKDNLKSVDAYGRMINQGIPSLILETRISENTLADTLAKEISVFLIQKFVDPQWLEDVTNKAIDGTVNFIAQKDQNVSLNLTGAKMFLNNVSSGLFLANEFIPPCGSASDKKPDTETLSLLNPSYICHEKGINLDEIKTELSVIQQKIQAINTGVVKLDGFIGEINADVDAVRTFVKDLYFYLITSLVLMLIIAGVVVGLYWRNKILILRALSIFIAIGSFIALALGFFSSLLVPKGISGSLATALPSSIKAILNDFLNVSISGVFHRLELYAGIILAVFVAVYIFTFLKKKTFFN